MGQVTLPLTVPVYALLLRSSEVKLVTQPRAEGMGTGWPLICDSKGGGLGGFGWVHGQRCVLWTCEIRRESHDFTSLCTANQPIKPTMALYRFGRRLLSATAVGRPAVPHVTPVHAPPAMQGLGDVQLSLA